MIYVSHLFRLVLLTACLALCAWPARAVERRATGGTLAGQTMPDGSTLFLGIPYAAPPVGDLRWKPPQPVVPWRGARDATKAPSPCLQHREGWNDADAARSREDCLYLSIRSPRHDPTDRLPVLLWIHGGSNRAGSGFHTAIDSPLYRRGVVVVALEYRLGVFGFLALPELTAESPHKASGNYGILDQIAALEWIKSNIAQFGGDPGNVTVAGQSAGARDIGILLLSPLAQGLFQKAILESGPVSFPRSLAENEKVGDDFAKLMKVSDAQALTALRAAPADSVLAAGEKLKPPQGVDPGLLWLQAMVDGWVLPHTPDEIMSRGRQAPVPLILGGNTRELPFDPPADALRTMIQNTFGVTADAALELYGLTAKNPVDDPILGSAGTQFLTDIAFRCPANRVADEQAASGQAVWRYQFGVAEPGSDAPVRHNAELRYVFDAAPARADFGNWPPVQRYWANFMRSGNPNGPGLPHWPDLGDERFYMAFTPDGPKVRNDLRGTLCRLMP